MVPTESGLQLAESRGLDLVLISESATPPVCKIVDYGQYRYQQQKKDKQAKKGGRGQTIKELKLSSKISDNDFNTRAAHGREFLQKGYKVKASLLFKGREIVHPELGRGVMERFVTEVSEFGAPESPVSQSNRSLLVIIIPK